MELTTSIAEIGLLHAPVVRETAAGLTLVSGERRLRAIEDLFMLGHSLFYNNKVIEPGSVPYVTLGELSFLEAEEAELDENLKRRDLTWQELAAAHERLHKLRQKQSEAAFGLAYTDEADQEGHYIWTTADTAKELSGRSDGAYQDKVRRELIVAKHLHNPEIQKAKTVDEAFKLLKQQENRERNIALAEETGKTFSSAIHDLFNIDCLEWMRAYADGMPDNPGSGVDVICTDPPYGMGADSFGDAAGKLSGIQHHYDDSREAWMLLMEAWCPLSYQVCKPQAHAYVFCDILNFADLKTLMQQAGWYVFRTPFICVKPNSGRVPLPDQGPRRQYETLLYAIKGKKPVTHIYPDVISTTADEQLSHGAQKPVALFKNLLQRSVRPGDVVLDCFAGTGPIIPAAHHFQCKAIVLEKEKEYYAICCERLKALEEGE
jgi:DNA modification methylase/ParB-like chromosome segregation protein Spo0J